MKKVWMCFLALCICAGTVVCPVGRDVSVWAEEENTDSGSQTYQEWEYCILEDGTARITGYTGKDETMDIPSKVVGVDGSEIIVTDIDGSIFDINENVRSVIIPEGVKSLHGNFGTRFSGKKLESINVSEENPYYSSEDGVLYNKEKTILY